MCSSFDIPLFLVDLYHSAELEQGGRGLLEIANPTDESGMNESMPRLAKRHYFLRLINA